jgi:molybdopterin synthase catalytic subunit/molybdopterin converting factor small subunit
MSGRRDEHAAARDSSRATVSEFTRAEADAPSAEDARAPHVSVRVLFFGAAREAAADETLLRVAPGETAREAFERLLELYPRLRRFRDSLLVAVNQEYARDLSAELKEGDELAVFPPVSGGGEDEPASARGALDFFELTTEPIDVGAVARRAVPRRCGATVTLDGYAREWTRGRRTLHLVYEAYAPMALAEMRRLGAQAHGLFNIEHIGIVHRTGRTEIGETSVVISVSAPHRRAAFEACEWAIRELKRTVPIWKKEFFEDGSVWVEGEGAPAAQAGETQG